MPAQDYEGLTGPDYEVDIERGKIRDFARAMSAPLPDFLEGRRAVVPATFLVAAPYTFGYTLERPRGTVFQTIDHDFSVPLHAEESFLFHGPPPRAGDRLIARASLEKVVRKSGSSGGDLTFLTMLTTYKSETGEPVADQRSVTVTTSNSPGGDDWGADVPDYKPDYPELEPGDLFAGIRRVGWDDLSEGDGPGAVDTGPMRVGDMVRFQGVVGEDNPLHYDAPWAHDCGYPAVFGLGMHQASLLAGYAAHWIDPATVRSFKARFRNVFWPGERMIHNAVVTRKYRNDAGAPCADLHLTCTRDNGDSIVDAWMTCRFDG
ncbi:MAG: MaoC family dehydratase N-terminal domain-containing protein [Alphaproteobacteria bacterium]